MGISVLVLMMGIGGLRTRKCLRWLRHRGSGVLSEAPSRTRRGGAGLVLVEKEDRADKRQYSEKRIDDIPRK